MPWCRPFITDQTTDSNSTDLDDEPNIDGGNSSMTNNSTRFAPAGAMMIRNGRYSIDVAKSGLIPVGGPTDHVPNDTYAADGKNFTIITGINGSGKVRGVCMIQSLSFFFFLPCRLKGDSPFLLYRQRI